MPVYKCSLFADCRTAESRQKVVAKYHEVTPNGGCAIRPLRAIPRECPLFRRRSDLQRLCNGIGQGRVKVRRLQEMRQFAGEYCVANGDELRRTATARRRIPDSKSGAPHGVVGSNPMPSADRKFFDNLHLWIYHESVRCDGRFGPCNDFATTPTPQLAPVIRLRVECRTGWWCVDRSGAPRPAFDSSTASQPVG